MGGGYNAATEGPGLNYVGLLEGLITVGKDQQSRQDRGTENLPIASIGLRRQLVESIYLLLGLELIELRSILKQKQRHCKIILLSENGHLAHRLSKPDPGTVIDPDLPVD